MHSHDAKEPPRVPKLVNCQFSRRLLARISAVLCACESALFIALLLLSPLPALSQHVAENGLDRSIKPGDDFYRYANGSWLKTTSIPTGRSTYDTRAILAERTTQQVSDLIQDAARSHATPGSTAQKVGDYYASFLDEATIEAKGLTPLADEFARIAAITNKTQLSAYLGTTLSAEVDGLTASSEHIFGLWINQGFQDADHNVVHFFQGGIGLPDRDDYLDSSQKKAALRAQYQAHIAAMLKLTGITDADTRAASVLVLETRIAQAFAPTPMPPMFSSRTTHGSAPNSQSRLREWTGTPISSRLDWLNNPISQCGSYPPSPVSLPL